MVVARPLWDQDSASPLTQAPRERFDFPRTASCGQTCVRVRLRVRGGDPMRWVVHDPLAHERGDGIRLDLGPLVVDQATRRAFLRGARLPLTPTEYRLLAAVAQRRGAIVSREVVLTEAWGPEYHDYYHLLRVNAARVRVKLGSDRPLLLTEVGIGLRIDTSAVPS